MKQGSIYIQGDVVMKRIATIPKEAKPLKRKELAYGEVTGHSHSITDLSSAELLANGEDHLYLVVTSNGEIRHEEHAPHQPIPGNYQVLPQVEDTEWGAQNVVD